MIAEYLDRSMSYAEYIKLIDDLLLDGKTTGPVQSEAMLSYAKINRQRMYRLEKTVELEPSLVLAAKGLMRKVIWLVITEGWCGDSAQSVPLIQKTAEQSDNIESRYILRDENLDVMDQFLTNGARSIPKLIAIDALTLQILNTWGPRPLGAQQLFEQLKHSGMEKLAIMEQLQRWYNADKSRSIQHELQYFIEQGKVERVL